MRVIAGSAKGTRLYGARGYRIRPITDSIKESLFELLGDRAEVDDVLDLFAGVGSLGIEALSRGAGHADFIEMHHATAASIIGNLERTHLADRGRVIVAGLPGGLGRLGHRRTSTSESTGSYGLIFVDPPFRIEARLLDELFLRISSAEMLEAGGLIVYRHSPQSSYEPPGDELELEERRHYGGSTICMYRMTDDVSGVQS